MAKVSQYKIKNEEFLQEVAKKENVQNIGKGLLVEVLKEGSGVSPTSANVVSVYYKGATIDGHVFDDNTQQGYPDAFRLQELIVAWQMALPKMKVGDKWKIYVPAELGYGSKGSNGIPRHSTLIFEIELVNVN